MFGECHAHVIMDGINYKEWHRKRDRFRCHLGIKQGCRLAKNIC